jgi:hypothetical protein
MKKVKKVLAIDLLSYNNSHLTVNSFWVSLLLNEKFDAEFVFESNHANALSKIIRKHFPLIEIKRGIGWYLKRELIFFWYCCTFFIRYDSFIILGSTGLQVLTLSVLSFIDPFQISKRITLIHHSELEGVSKLALGTMKRLTGLAYRFFSPYKKVNIIVLGDYIKDNLERIGHISYKIRSVPHPLPYTLGLQHKNCDLKGKINIALIGSINGHQKNLRIAKLFANAPDFHLWLIGRIGFDFEELGNVTKINAGVTYTNEWMQEKLNNVDFLLIALPDNAYNFTASGVVTDSYLYSKPCIWLKHESLKGYENSPLSICSSTIDGLIRKIRSHKHIDTDRINKYVSTYNSLVASRFFDSLS